MQNCRLLYCVKVVRKLSNLILALLYLILAFILDPRDYKDETGPIFLQAYSLVPSQF